MRPALRLVCVLGGLLAAGRLAPELEPNDYEGGRSRDVAAGAERNTSALAMVLGQFRAALSDLIFMKTELYLHSGVAYEPHLEGATLATVGMLGEIDEEHADASSKQRLVVEEGSAGESATIIPTAETDWRGFVGHLERKVKPWRDPSEPHVLTDGREMLPWFRVMTLTDPHYVRGYAVGAWWLKRRNLDAAIAFAQEGITNNPSSFEILYTLGELYMARGRIANNDQLLPANEQSLVHFRAARDAFQKGAEIAITRRPPGWVNNPEHPSPSWTYYQEEDAHDSARMAVLTEKNYGDPAKARALAGRYHEKLAPDEILRRAATETP